jgi:hypothetical protein
MIPGARAQAGQRPDDKREAVGEIIARTAIEPHLRASLAGNDATLDFARKESACVVSTDSEPD